MAMPNVPLALINLTGAQLRRARRHWHALSKAVARLGRRAQRQQEILMHAPAQARARVQRGKAAIGRSRNRLSRFDDHVLAPYRIERRVKRALASGASSGRPIIVGPWTSEVGYEALYWIPFLHWALDCYRIDRQRVIAVSRGGTEAWYRGVAGRYVDVFDCMGPDEFAGEMRTRREQGDQKQLTTSGLDRHLAGLVAERVGIRDAVVWHPGLMYQLFRSFWYGDRSLQFFLRHTDFDRTRAALTTAVHQPVPADLPALPSGYVAVKFYTGPSL